MIGRAITATSLGEEGVVVIAAVHQITGLEATNPAKRQIAIRAGRQTSRVLGNARSEQSKIGVTATVQGQLVDGSFVDQRRHSTGLGFDQRRLTRNRHRLFCSRDRKFEFKLRGATNVHLQAWGGLRGHSTGLCAPGIFPRRKQFE